MMLGAMVLVTARRLQKAPTGKTNTEGTGGVGTCSLQRLPRVQDHTP